MHVTRQIDGDSGWGGGVRLASGRAAAAAAEQHLRQLNPGPLTQPGGRGLYTTELCPLLACGWHALAEVAVQVDRLVVSWAV